MSKKKSEFTIIENDTCYGKEYFICNSVGRIFAVTYRFHDAMVIANAFNKNVPDIG